MDFSKLFCFGLMTYIIWFTFAILIDRLDFLLIFYGSTLNTFLI